MTRVEGPFSALYFVSDLHLKSASEDRSQMLIGFLRRLATLKPESPDSLQGLVLLGDIFDLWLSNYPYFIGKWHSVITEFAKLPSSQFQVHYFQGNHDLYLKKYWQKELGFFIHEEPAFFQVDQWRVRAEHGDLINPKDYGYKILHRILRFPLTQVVLEHLPESLVVSAGEKLSPLSREYTSNQKSLTWEEGLGLMVDYSRRAHAQRPFDFHILGHTHIRAQEVVTAPDHSWTCFNLGDWGRSRPTVLKITATGAEWIDLPPLKA